jgi:TPR repeat protein
MIRELGRWAAALEDAGRLTEAQRCRAAASGDVPAMRDAATILYEHDADGALRQWLYRPAAEAGDPDAMAELGELLYRHSVEDGHDREGWDLLQRALDAGSVRALSYVAFDCEEKGHLDQAERLYLRGVDAGDADAMLMFANMLSDQEDFERAETYYRRAIASGSVVALTNLAVMHHLRGNWADAARLYRRAVEAGDGTPLTQLLMLVDLDEADIEELRARCMAAKPLNNALLGFVCWGHMPSPPEKLARAIPWSDDPGISPR